MPVKEMASLFCCENLKFKNHSSIWEMPVILYLAIKKKHSWKRKARNSNPSQQVIRLWQDSTSLTSALSNFKFSLYSFCISFLSLSVKVQSYSVADKQLFILYKTCPLFLTYKHGSLLLWIPCLAASCTHSSLLLPAAPHPSLLSVSIPYQLAEPPGRSTGADLEPGEGWLATYMCWLVNPPEKPYR